MTTAWDHLPNAQHIDRILADVKVNPNNWVQALDAVYYAALDAVYYAAWDAARNAAWPAAWPTAGTAILALIAWDEAGDYLSLPADQVQVLAALGDHKAVLILPAAIAFDQQKEIT